MSTRLPAPIEGAADIAKFTTGLASAVASVWFPPAAIAGPVLSYLVDHLIGHAQKIILKELEAGNIEALSPEQVVEYVPMAYKFFEAAKEGEYEHNLRILASYIANELKQDVPDAASFSRMARRIEGLTRVELKVIAQISSAQSKIISSTGQGQTQSPRWSGSAGDLQAHSNNADGLELFQLREVLAELASRGLLIVSTISLYGGSKEIFSVSAAFLDLVDKAKQAIDAANA